MPIQTRTFRIFVSSTFEDLKEERDALQRDVFPKLRTLCELHGARFQAIDLRWGVRDEAALDQQTVEICLSEIRRCQSTCVKPNFIALLGDRYGWQPLPARIPAAEFDALLPHIPTGDARTWTGQWYRLEENAIPPEYCLQARTGEFVTQAAWTPIEQTLRASLANAARAAGLSEKELVKYEASATHQEILAGLGETEADRQHVFGFVRRPTFDTDPRLNALKSPLRVHEFDPGDMKALCALVLSQLSEVIEREVRLFEDRPALELEVEAHDRFAEERCRIFTGRQAVLDTIVDYVRGPERRPLVLRGESGSGKSAVMAKASQEYSGSGRLIRRFIGASPESASGRALLTSLCRQIAPGETPVDYAQLENAFQERLKAATADEPLVLFIDALDQLLHGDPARLGTWLPRELPPHVKVVVSTTDDATGLLVQLEPMTRAEGGETLDKWLRDARRTLQPWQRETVLAHFERCGLPLYLKLAAEESRLWKSYAAPDVCRLGEGVAGVIDTLFDRLAGNANHGPILVERSLGYLAAARYGLTEGEVLDVLTADDAVWSDFDQRKHHDVSERRLPVVVWSRLSLDLEPYLTERAAPGGMVIAFYHRQLAERAAIRYLEGTQKQVRHSDLARYFLGKPPWLDEGRKTPNARRAAELVFEQRGARQWAGAEATLFDSQFLLAKVAAKLVLDLAADYQALLQEAPEMSLPRREALRLIHGTLRLSLHVVAQDPGQFASQISGRLLAHQTKPGIAAFLQDFNACTSRPRLRPLWPALEAAGGWALRRLEGHTDKVRAVALSDDGGCAISGSYDCTLRVWDLEGGRPPRVLEGHTGPVIAVALSGDGRRAISGSHDSTLRVWDLEGNEPPRVLGRHADWVTAVALSADGRRAVSGSDDETLRVWDLEGNQPPRIEDGAAGRVNAVALSNDGKRAVYLLDNHTLRVWDLEGNQRPRDIGGQIGWICAVALSGDGKCAVVSDERTLVVWDLEGNQPPRLLKGHTDSVFAVALSGDGKHAVSGSAALKKTVLVWDMEDKQPPRALEGHLSEVRAVALSANGKRAISGSDDNTVRVWDLEGNRPPQVLKGHTNCVDFVALSGDGKRAVSRSYNDNALVWDLEGNHLPRVLECYTDVALSADGKRAISGSNDQTLPVWDLEDNQPPRVLRGEGNWDWIMAVALSADGKRAVSGSDDCAVRVWDLEGNHPPRLLEGHTGPIRAVALTADGKCAVSASADETLRVWDLEGNQPPRVLEGAGSEIRAVALSGDGKRAIYLSRNHTVRLWDLDGNQPPRVLKGYASQVRAVALSADGKRAVLGLADHTLWVWDLEGNRPPYLLEGHTRQVLAVALSGDGKRAISGSEDHTVRVWDLEGKQPPCIPEGHGSTIGHVAIQPDGKLAASCGEEGTLRVWDLTDDESPRLLEVHKATARAVALSGDGKCALGWENTVRVWDPGGNLRVLEGHTDRVIAVALTADGRRVVSGSYDKTLRVWDLEGNEAPRVLEGHTRSVIAVALEADGKRAISGSDDSTVRVWDLEGDLPPRVLEGHSGTVNAVALTADGKRAISGSDDNTVRVWDLEGDLPPRVLKGHTGSVTAVALSADGTRAISSSNDHSLRVWDMVSGNCLTGFTCDYDVPSCAWAGQRLVAGDSFGHFHLLAWEE